MGNKAKFLHKLKEKGFNVPDLISVNNKIQTETELFDIVFKKFDESMIFAVRSSASNEDSNESSMAGFYYSALGVDKESLFEEYKKVIASYKGIEGQVIIQQFIPSEKAGIIFTDRGDRKSVINASFGLCKTVVEGNACDEYIVSDDFSIDSKHISDEKECLYFESKNFRTKSNIAEETLTEKEVQTLVSKAKEIEKFFGSAQDIEWCFYKTELFILQSRPVTRKITENKEITMYDSANIAESYSGIISPLTISFASRIYKIVYQNLLIASGASRKKIAKHKNIFDNMTASFYGRIYYNMNNWYLMMSFMPGYQRNKENLEDMITSNVREKIMRSVQPSFGLKLAYPFIVAGKMLTFDKTRKNFINKVKNSLKYFRESNLEEWDFEKCSEEYHKLSENLLEKWHIPVENDFLMMTYLGILKKKHSEDKLKDMIQFGNISSKQVDMLKNLSDKMHKIPEFKECIDNKDVTTFDKLLEKHIELKTSLNQYFEIYGGRFANELKLESTDISENKEKMLSVLQFYNKLEISQQPKEENIPKESLVLKKFKKYASQREEMRLLRSNTFGIVRKLFNRMGTILQNQSKIETKKDIYFLDLEEIFNSQKSPYDYKKLIAERKKEYEHYSKIQPEAHFQIAEGDEVPLVSFEYEAVETIEARPCTSGIASGVAKVFQEFYLPENTDFDILVAKNTDPGWTPLIGLSKGLIIEHGGILSHAAIVSRELGIPTVIGAKNATKIIKDNSKVKINGKTGQISILKK
ncbi:MAG: hypothetical protein JXL97_15680 [Bacteroidales bacterium]|nr:hypothetical protein [Bacteroidales bacterium]